MIEDVLSVVVKGDLLHLPILLHQLLHLHTADEAGEEDGGRARVKRGDQVNEDLEELIEFWIVMGEAFVVNDGQDDVR